MPIVKKIRKGIFDEISKASALKNFGLPEKLADLSKRDRLEAKNELEKMMLEAATNLEFEKAARLRDILKTLA